MLFEFPCGYRYTYSSPGSREKVYIYSRQMYLCIGKLKAVYTYIGKYVIDIIICHDQLQVELE